MADKTSEVGGLLLRGSMITLKRKCGKPNCRCAAGDPHETPALSYSLRGVTRILTLPPSEVPLAQAALDRYKQAMAKLDGQALAGIRAMERRIRKERARRKGGGR